MRNAANGSRDVLQFVFMAAMAALVLVLFVVTTPPRLEAQRVPSIPTANRCYAVTPSDTLDLPPYAQSGPQYLTTYLYIGGAGNIAVALGDGTAVLFTAPPVGTLLPVAVRRVNATNTTATAIVACYQF